MRIGTYRYEGERFVGRIDDDGATVHPYALDAAEAAHGVLALIDRAAAGTEPPAERPDAIDLTDVMLEAPIPRPRRNVFCVGRNYHAHAQELSASVFKDQGLEPARWPIVFTKVPETVVGPFDAVELPATSQQIDYEAELAIVIGRSGRDIARDEALSHVYGYTIVDDVTARDVQMRHQQWHLGKSFDTFCPMGPWIATADAFDGRDTRLRCWVNGALRQDASTRDLIFDIPTLIETCSRGITLYPGDVIATGTPAGVGMGMTPPAWLQDGDLVRIEIDGLGVIENRFVQRGRHGGQVHG